MQVRFAPKATDVLRRRGRQPVGRLAEDPERAVARRLAIALAILGKRDACLRDRRRRQTPLSGLGGVIGRHAFPQKLARRSTAKTPPLGDRGGVSALGTQRKHRSEHDTQTRHSDEEARNQITIPVMSTAKQENSRRSLRSTCIPPPPLTFPP